MCNKMKNLHQILITVACDANIFKTSYYTILIAKAEQHAENYMKSDNHLLNI